MQVVTRARSFKRSWVDMAELLVQVRKRGLHEAWGYETIQGYALEELNIKRTTCDKLTGSFSALERHVPHVLTWDGVAQEMPAMESVDYFARAVDPRPKKEGDPTPEPPDGEVVEELKQAIFEDLAGAPALRRRFGAVLNPKDEAQERKELLGRVRSNARRLESLVTHIDGLSEERVEGVTQCLEQLRVDLDALE